MKRKRRFGDRKDARRVRDITSMMQLNVDLKPGRSVSDVYINQRMDLTKLAKYVDVFLPDLKFCDSNLSMRVATCPNYFEVATAAIKEMRKQKPIDIFDKNGVMTSGVAVRHLVLPNHTNDSKKIVDFLSKNLNGTILCLMSQYVPFDRAKDMPDLNRKLKPIEYNSVLHYAQQKLNGQIFAQDFSSATEEYIPKWNTDNI